MMLWYCVLLSTLLLCCSAFLLTWLSFAFAFQFALAIMLSHIMLLSFPTVSHGWTVFDSPFLSSVSISLFCLLCLLSAWVFLYVWLNDVAIFLFCCWKGLFALYFPLTIDSLHLLDDLQSCSIRGFVCSRMDGKYCVFIILLFCF